MVSAVAISNAETREREKLKELFEEAYERCRTAPMEGVSFTIDDFHSAIEKYDFNSEVGTKVSTFTTIYCPSFISSSWSFFFIPFFLFGVGFGNNTGFWQVGLRSLMRFFILFYFFVGVQFELKIGSWCCLV